MVSVTSWTRLEPRCRHATMADGLAAPIHDPLWSLARQWMVGEFRGHDGGSPMMATVRGTSDRLTEYRPGGGEPIPFDPHTTVLEMLVESELAIPSDDDTRPDLRSAAEAGRHLFRLLRRHGLGRYAAELRRRSVMERPPQVAEVSDDRVVRFLGVVGGRVIDGRRLHDDLAALPRDDDGTPRELPEWITVDDADGDALASVLGRWLAWYETNHRPQAADGSWQHDRLEYRFSMATAGGTTLAANGHDGSRLDWYSFDVETVGDAVPDIDPPVLVHALPTPLAFPGMPKGRWWTFEDEGVDFGGVDTDVEDLATMRFLEVMIAYGNNWFVVPLDLETAALHRIDSVVVADSFGVPTSLSPLGAEGEAWRFLEPEGVPPDDRGRLVALLPGVTGPLIGGVVEDVVLQRDEVANLVWGIERMVESRVGGPGERRGASDAEDEQAAPPAADAPLSYRLSLDPPEHWYPFAAKRSTSGELRLEQAELVTGQDRRSPPLGRVLRPPGGRLRVHAEEVPRPGVAITRRYQFARSPDGSCHVWAARRAQPGTGEARSGLRFDTVLPQEDAEAD